MMKFLMPYDWYGIYLLFVIVLAIGTANRSAEKEAANAGNELETPTRVFFDKQESREASLGDDSTLPVSEKPDIFEDPEEWINERFYEMSEFTDGYGFCPEALKSFVQAFDNAIYDFLDSLANFLLESLWIWFFYCFKPTMTVIFFCLETLFDVIAFLLGYKIFFITACFFYFLYFLFSVVWYGFFVYSMVSTFPFFGV